MTKQPFPFRISGEDAPLDPRQTRSVDLSEYEEDDYADYADNKVDDPGEEHLNYPGGPNPVMTLEMNDLIRVPDS